MFCFSNQYVLRSFNSMDQSSVMPETMATAEKVSQATKDIASSAMEASGEFVKQSFHGMISAWNKQLESKADK